MGGKKAYTTGMIMDSKTVPRAPKKQRESITTEATREREVTPKEIITFPLFRHRREPSVHWKNSKELHSVLNKLPGIFKAVLLELADGPMSRHEIRDFLNRMGRDRHNRGTGKAQLNLEADLCKTIDLKVVEERDGRYHLTPGGREIAEHMQRLIPAFMKWVLSPETASFLSIWVHVALSILKLGIGFLSRSAGLTADGIDNTVDTLSSLLVWMGIKHDKEKLVSIFILISMFGSVGGVAWATFDKIVHPGPVTEGLIAFTVSGICGIVMLGLSSYQYLVGKRRSNFAILCQAVDSRNHLWTSLLVCGGILLSFFAEGWRAPWLYYADAAVSTIIGMLILRGALELVQELLKESEGGNAEVSHFMKRTEERMREKILFKWLTGQLQSTSLTRGELVERFTADFCQQPPKILILSGMGYRPESEADLLRYLDLFVEQRKLVCDEGKYWLAARS